MQHHLFIGLGGQGGRTLGELRKVMAQRKRDAEILKGEDIRIGFLAIDSSDDVRNDKRTWTDFGADLALDPSDWLPLTRPSHDTIGALALRPDIAPWLGDRAYVDGFLQQAQIQGANQRRRFGRLLFAFNAAAIRAAVTEKVSSLANGRSHQCAFHVFATLGGGTGSGGLTDLVALIRNLHPGGDVDQFPVFVYVYATDADETGANVGYFFQNQYTGLRDLNALMCGRLNATVLGDDIAASVFSGTEPVAQVAITAPLNSANRRIRLDTQIRIVAEACFERIVAWSSGQMGPDAQRSLTGQDILSTFPAEPPGRPERSYRFSALGMRRWEVPHEKIRALLALDLLAASLRQMLFDNWHESNGFSNQLAEDSAGAVGAAASDLVTQIQEADRPAQNVDALVKRLRDALTQQAKGLSRPSHQTSVTLRTIEEELAAYYSQHFEGVGVDAVIRQRESEQPENIKDVIRHLEASLTRLWLDRTHPLALARIPQVIDELASRLRREFGSPPDDHAASDYRQRVIAARRLEWHKLTWLSTNLTPKRRALIEAHAVDCGTAHEVDLRMRLQQLDRRFVKDLLGYLTNVSRHFRTVQQVLRGLLETVQQERDVIDRELRNLHRDVAANKYEFEPDALDAFLIWMRRHREHQNAAAFVMREKIARDIGNNQPLSALANTNIAAIEDGLKRVAKEQAGLIHQDYQVNGQGRPILEESVLDILEQRHRDEPQAFLQELQDFLGQAAVCLRLRNDIQPVQLLGSGVGVPHMPKRLLLIGLPRHAFATVLQQRFRAAMTAGQNRVLEAFEHDDPGQIRLLAVDYWLAARFSTVVKALADKYDATSASAQNTDTPYFCNIDPDGEKGLRPDLFLPNDTDMRLRYEAELWLGRQPGVRVVQHGTNGVFLIREDQDGRHAEPLGQTLEGSLETADYAKMFALHERLAAALAHLDREAFDALVNGQRAAIEQEHGLTSKEYGRWDRMLKLLKPLVD